ncbi:MAG: hypothetical protein LBL75_01135 [Rickettsiales bacterium]|jgi:hypothetical protein|nr:hypothetical protein [Rickettsiales bacterium]
MTKIKKDKVYGCWPVGLAGIAGIGGVAYGVMKLTNCVFNISNQTFEQVTDYVGYGVGAAFLTALASAFVLVGSVKQSSNEKTR